LALRRLHQSIKSPANRRIIDGPADPVCLRESDSAEKCTTRLTRLVRRGVDDPEVDLGKGNKNLAHGESISTGYPTSQLHPGGHSHFVT